MSAELEELLRANPDDAGAWSVYADWLIEQHDPRGMLVRVPRRLTTQEVKGWHGAIPPACATRWLHGFVVAIAVPFDHRTPHTLAKIFEEPQARLIGELNVHDSRNLDDSKFHVDAKPSEYGQQPAGLLDQVLAVDLSRIRRLAIQHIEVGDAGVAAIAAARVGPLLSLDLRYGSLGDAGVEALVASGLLDGVRSLYLQRNGITEPGARALARCARLATLEHVDLRFNAIGPAGARALASSPYVGRLARLLMHPDDIGGDGVQALATSTTLPLAARRYWSARA